MLKGLVAGDVVMVTRIGRLARSTFDLFAIVKQIVDAKAQFRSLAEPRADTCTGRLMIALLGGLADVERDLIRTHTAEGRRRSAGSIWADRPNCPLAFGVDPKSWPNNGPLRAAGLTKVWGSSYLGRWARCAATISIFPCRAN